MGGYDKLKTEYLCWLMNRAQLDAEGPGGYRTLCERLQETEFVPQLEMDGNRNEDCLELRVDYATYCTDIQDADECDVTWMLEQCFGEHGTMMELILVLAEKMQYETLESEFEAGTGKWFRELLSNCGLHRCTNEEMEENPEDVEEILERIIYRQIGWDGEGGLFPLMYPIRNQRYAELIAQMNDYLEENYELC